MLRENKKCCLLNHIMLTNGRGLNQVYVLSSGFLSLTYINLNKVTYIRIKGKKNNSPFVTPRILTCHDTFIYNYTDNKILIKLGQDGINIIYILFYVLNIFTYYEIINIY